MVDWGYFEKFEDVNDRYLPDFGQGETMATQIVTAVNKLIYKWYNDGDVYDNTYYFEGWCNDLSSYANWLVKYTDRADMLYDISVAYIDSDYEEILKKLADTMLDMDYLEKENELPSVGSIYECNGIFRFVENCDEEEDW